RFEWVKGHMGHALNEAADARARAAADASQRRTAIPSGPGVPGGVSVGSAPLVAPNLAPTLFDDAPALMLSPTQRGRLEQRARDAGISLDEALRDLI
ncbi:MAG: DUF4440 domain-containing protein, partial [Salinibacterium sp.]|nr:DUF4440 domain-containing protein [Salinibacterium sp.]